MNSVFLDAKIPDDLRRQRLYEGQLFVYGPVPSSIALCNFARQMAEEAFAPFDPRQAQHDLPIERFAAILADLKPKFIHHPRSKQLIQQLV